MTSSTHRHRLRWPLEFANDIVQGNDMRKLQKRTLSDEVTIILQKVLPRCYEIEEIKPGSDYQRLVAV